MDEYSTQRTRLGFFADIYESARGPAPVVLLKILKKIGMRVVICWSFWTHPCEIPCEIDW